MSITSPARTRAILTDIEGTTTSIAFVYDVLFPYAAARLEKACARPDPGPELAATLARLRDEHGREPASDPPPPFGDGAPYARWLMERDRKSTGLKLVQGLLWEEGYASGELRGHVYPDVPPALAAWRAAGVRLRIFSSGSVKAQQLLFGHTDYGDLTPTEHSIKKVAAFYTWTRKNAPLQVAEMARQPGKFTAVAKAYDAAGGPQGERQRARGAPRGSP